MMADETAEVATAEAVPVEAAERGEAGEAKGAEEKPPENESAKAYNRQFAALTRKEKALKQREAEVHRQLSERQRDLEELQTYRQLRQAARQNPDAWLKGAGLDFDALQNHYKQAGRSPEDLRLEGTSAQVQELQKRLDERDAQLKNAFREMAKNQYLDRIDRVIQADPEAYELLQAENRAQDVFSLIDAYLQKTGEELSIKEACSILEDTLLSEREADAKRIRGYKKLAPRLGWEPPVAPQPGTKAPSAKPKQSGKTISHASAPSASPTPKKAGKTHPEDEWAAVVERFKSGG